MRNVTIQYQTHDGEVPIVLQLEPSQYYDPLDDVADTYESDGVPKFTSPDQYVPVDIDDLKYVLIVEPDTTGCRETRVQYLDGLQSHCIHSIWADGTEELIHSTDISPNMYHIIRTQKDRNGFWSVVMNVYGHNFDEVPAVDHLGRYNWEQLRDFW